MKVSTTSLLLASLCSSAFAAPITADVNANADVDVETRDIVGNTVQSVTGTTGLENLANVNGVEKDVGGIAGQNGGILAHDGTKATVVVNDGELLSTDADVKANIGNGPLADAKVNARYDGGIAIAIEAEAIYEDLDIDARAVDIDADVTTGKQIKADVDAAINADVNTEANVNVRDAVLDNGVVVAAVDVNARGVNVDASVAAGQMIDTDADVEVNSRAVNVDADVATGEQIKAAVDANVNVDARSVNVDAKVAAAQLLGTDTNVKANIANDQLADANVDVRDVDADVTANVATGQRANTDVNADVNVDARNVGVNANVATDQRVNAAADINADVEGVSARGIVGDATDSVESTVKSATGVDVNGIVGSGATQDLTGNL